MANVILKLSGVKKTYTQGSEVITALNSTNLTINAGQLVAILGPSGSGKSTLLTIAGGLQSPTEGKVEIDDLDITTMNNKQRSRVRLEHIGFILQSSNLVSFLNTEQQLQLIDQVSSAHLDQQKMQDLFYRLEIDHLRKKYPADLSGGERQRVAIAKALYGQANLILADEPTASLDTKRAFEVVELLAQQTRQNNKATVMVTHDERLISYCDQVYRMSDGVLKQDKAHPKSSKK